MKVTDDHKKTLKQIVERKESFENPLILKIVFDINNLIFV